MISKGHMEPTMNKTEPCSKTIGKNEGVHIETITLNQLYKTSHTFYYNFIEWIFFNIQFDKKEVNFMVNLMHLY